VLSYAEAGAPHPDARADDRHVRGRDVRYGRPGQDRTQEGNTGLQALRARRAGARSGGYAWAAMLERSGGVHRTRFAIFTDLLAGWCAHPRRHRHRMIAGRPRGGGAHDAYTGSARRRLEEEPLWHISAGTRVGGGPRGPCSQVCARPCTPRPAEVAGSGIFRDAVRSTVKKVVYARGWNWSYLACASPRWAAARSPSRQRRCTARRPTTTIGHAAN